MAKLYIAIMVEEETSDQFKKIEMKKISLPPNTLIN